MSETATICPILILAAGQSSRMRGRDKLLETVDGVPILRSRAQATVATGQEVIVVLPPEDTARRAALEGIPVRIVVADNARDGMAASLVAGIAALPDGAQQVMILLADLPELETDDLNMVRTAAGREPEAIWRGASATGRPGHPVIFPARLFGDLLRLEGDAGAQKVIAAHSRDLRLCPLPKERATTDLDTPEAWDAWRRARAAQ